MTKVFRVQGVVNFVLNVMKIQELKNRIEYEKREWQEELSDCLKDGKGILLLFCLFIVFIIIILIENGI